LDDEERQRLDLERRVKLAQEAAESHKKEVEAPTDLDLEKKGEIKFSLKVEPKVVPKMISIEDNEEEKQKEQEREVAKGKERKEMERRESLTKKDQTNKKRKEPSSTVTTPQDDKKLKLEKQLKRKANWLVKDIVVKVVDNKFSNGKYYKQKGVIEQVTENGFGAMVKLESGVRVKFQQEQLETVIPQLGKKVRIVNGLYRGEVGLLTDINMDKFCVKIKIETGQHKGTLSWEEYEDVCKIPE